MSSKVAITAGNKNIEEQYERLKSGYRKTGVSGVTKSLETAPPPATKGE
jgi:hypothetical protein